MPQQAKNMMRSKIDRMPVPDGQVLRAFSELPAEERAVVYLNSMRRMMVFFVWVTVIALVGALVLGIIDVITLSSIHQSQIPASPFG
jgi:hypothetical protein